MCLKEALKIKSLDSVKVLNFRLLEHEFSHSMRFVADTADFPAILHVSDAKDITRNRRETSLRYKQFGKSIVKYNAFKQFLLCFVQPLNLKVYRSHYEFFDGEFLIGAMYCML